MDRSISPTVAARIRRVRWGGPAAVVCFTLVAALLRGWQVDRMSPWQDEGLSLYRATKDLPFILSGVIQIGALPTQDVQPPLYFLLLAGWFQLLGAGTWVAKWLSILASLPAVPLTWALGRRWAGGAVGLAAAGLVALSPAYLWYAQEIRSYSLAVSLSLAAVYSLTRALAEDEAPRRRRAWAAGTVLANGLLVWTHYLGFFVVVFEVLWLAALALRRRGRWLAALLGLLLLVGLPLLPFAWQRLGLGIERHQLWQPPQDWLATMLGSYGMGQTMPAQLVPLGMLLFGAILAAGVLWLWRTRRVALWLMLGYLLVPTVAFFALTFVKPAFRGLQHLLLQSPAFYLLVGAGLVDLWRRRRPIGATAAALIVAAMLIADGAFYLDPSFAKDDLRGLAEYVDAHAAPGDILAVSDPVLELTFQNLVGNAELRTLPPMGADGLPEDRPPQELLAPLLAGRRRLWLMSPDDKLAEWLQDRALEVDRRDFHGKDIPVHLVAYERRPAGPDDLPPRWRSDAVLGGLRPLGFEVLPRPLVPGRGARVRLAWQSFEPDLPDRKISLRLLDASGQTVGQSDAVLPSSEWPYGEVTYWPTDLAVSPGAAPGPHRLALSVYDPATGESWPADEPLVLGELPVGRPAAPVAPESVPVGRRMAFEGGGMRLVGVDDPAPAGAAGAAFPLASWWQVTQDEPAARALRAELIDAFGRVTGSAELPLAPAEEPLRAGDLRRLTLPLHLPADAGRYGLRLTLLDEAGRRLWLRRGLLPVQGALVAAVDVEAPPHTMTVPELLHRLDATIGDGARLLGYDLPVTTPTAGEALPVTLFWRAEDRMPTSYRATVQLLPTDGSGQPTGAPVAQHDGLPADGSRPTTGWSPGEVITDPHALALPPDLAPGDYLLIAALYDPAHPELPRPAVSQGGQARDYVLLQPLRVGPDGR